MNKVLTVSIAAYNVEKFIQNALDSCVSEGIMNDLEVLVVDDGSTDKTAEIVKQYENKYPQTFRLIHKENGGYGTTINVSMMEATGKYFRLLDGDDWFDKQGLVNLVSYLKNTDVDAVFTKMYLCYPNVQKQENDTWASLVGRQMLLRDVPKNVFAGMWEFTVKTEILRKHPFELPAHTLYTDHLFLAYPIPYIKDVSFLDFPLYCYRLGYNEQSVSVSSRLKHIDEIVKVSTLLSDDYQKNGKMSLNREYALTRAQFCHMEAYSALLLSSCSIAAMKKLKKFDSRRELDSDIIAGTNSKSLKFIRMTNYYGYFFVKGLYWLRRKLKNNSTNDALQQ